MTSYEKTKKQYALTKTEQEQRKFDAGLKWYMNEKELIIARLQPRFGGFQKDYTQNVSYTRYVDEYDRYSKGEGNMGHHICVFESKYAGRKVN